MKFKSKIRIINAEQFTATNIPNGVFYRENEGKYFVITIHGQETYVDVTDWIVEEPDGVHHYPIKNEIFLNNYEPVIKCLK